MKAKRVSKKGGGSRSTPSTHLFAFLYAGAAPETADCLFYLGQKWPQLKYDRISQDALIDRARSKCASQFLDHCEEEVMIMLDHDIIFNPDDMKALARKCAETKGVVAGIYPKRGEGRALPVRLAENGEWTLGDDVLVKADMVSTGFMAIHRKVLEEMAPHFPDTIGGFRPYFAPTMVERERGWEYLSADWAFVTKVHKILGEGHVYAYLKPLLMHKGEKIYTIQDNLDPPAIAKPVTLHLSDGPSRSIPAVYFIPEHVSEFTGVAMADFDKGVNRGRQHIAEEWRGFEGETEWYQREDIGRSYIFDLAGWHLQGVGEAMCKSLNGDWKDKEVLDFGSGIGTVALHLALAGAGVECIEINEHLRNFTAFRANALETELFFVEEPEGKYDLIVAWHIFEHLPDPESALQMLLQHLKPEGTLFSESEFILDDAHPMHHERDDWEQILTAAGLSKDGPMYTLSRVAQEV